MADVQLQQNHHSRNKRKRLMARVDLTPMVDLAFLLITFFMLTTSLKEKYAMKVEQPVKSTSPREYPESAILTFILDKKDILWYYPGKQYLAMQQTTYTADGLSYLVHNKKLEVEEKFEGKFPLACIIKTTEEANYQNLVDILDVFVTDSIESYAIQDVCELEKMTIAQQ